MPKSRHLSIIEQESNLTSHSRIINSDEGEASVQADELDGSGELTGSHHPTKPFGSNTIEDLSGDDDSTVDSSLEPPPAYQIQPSDIEISQDGFHARATAACEFIYLNTL